MMFFSFATHFPQSYRYNYYRYKSEASTETETRAGQTGFQKKLKEI